MPAPTSYTEDELAEFMGRVLGTASGSVGGDLGPLFIGDLEETVPDVIARYGVATIAEATNIPKLQALARARAWAWAVDQYVTRYRLSMDGQTLDRHALYDHAKERAEYWESRVAVMSSLTPGSTVAQRPTFFTSAPGYRGR